MNDPVTITLTKEELTQRAKSYTIWLYGDPHQSENPDKWLEQFGFLCGFIDEQFPQERREMTPRICSKHQAPDPSCLLCNVTTP